VKQSEIEEQATNTVAKSNDLMQRATFNLTATEQKFIAYIISLIKPEDKELQFYNVKVSDFAQLCGYNPKSVYADFKALIEKIDDKCFWLTLGTGKNEVSFRFRWFSEAKYYKTKGVIRVLLNSEIKKYLLDLISQGNYTQYDLYNVLGLKSKYSIRLYELLKSYAYKGEILYKTQELKTLLGAETYKNFYDFRERVLKRSTQEINLYTDLEISFTLYDKDGNPIEDNPKGKTTKSVSFSIKKRDIEQTYLIYRKTIDEINKRNKQIKGQLEFDESGNITEY
jgi:plasmid replication initiation protein